MFSTVPSTVAPPNLYRSFSQFETACVHRESTGVALYSGAERTMGRLTLCQREATRGSAHLHQVAGTREPIMKY